MSNWPVCQSTQENFKKLIKRELFPLNEINPNSKVHNKFYFYYFPLSKPIRAER